MRMRCGSKWVKSNKERDATQDGINKRNPNTSQCTRIDLTKEYSTEEHVQAGSARIIRFCTETIPSSSPPPSRGSRRCSLLSLLHHTRTPTRSALATSYSHGTRSRRPWNAVLKFLQHCVPTSFLHTRLIARHLLPPSCFISHSATHQHCGNTFNIITDSITACITSPAHWTRTRCATEAATLDRLLRGSRVRSRHWCTLCTRSALHLYVKLTFRSTAHA